jgi:hypothetical protein
MIPVRQEDNGTGSSALPLPTARWFETAVPRGPAACSPSQACRKSVDLRAGPWSRTAGSQDRSHRWNDGDEVDEPYDAAM